MIYYYANVITGQLKKDFQLSDSKNYQKFLEVLNFFGIKEPVSVSEEFKKDIPVQMDIMFSSHYKNKKYSKLNKIIDTCPEALVVTDISVFGDEILQYYQLLFEKGIKLFVYDNPFFSTCNEQFEAKDWLQVREILSLLKQVKKVDRRGRKSIVDDNFVNIYWLYELYFINEKVAVKASGLSKNGFHIKANTYEKSRRYISDEKYMQEKYNISELPAHNKRKVEFEKIKQVFLITNDLNFSCITNGSYVFSEIMYKRLDIKNKKTLALAFKRYDLSLMKRFEETGKLTNVLKG